MLARSHVGTASGLQTRLSWLPAEDSSKSPEVDPSPGPTDRYWNQATGLGLLDLGQGCCCSFCCRSGSSQCCLHCSCLGHVGLRCSSLAQTRQLRYHARIDGSCQHVLGSFFFSQRVAATRDGYKTYPLKLKKGCRCMDMPCYSKFQHYTYYMHII